MTWLMAVHNNDGGELGVWGFDTREEAENALLEDVGNTFGAPLAEYEYEDVIFDAETYEGFTMSTNGVVDVMNTWYLTELVFPNREFIYE